MPGLFGFFALTPGSAVDTRAASDLLGEMAHRMGHRGDEIVETWTDLAQGLAVARIRIPSRTTATFPGERARRSEPESVRRGRDSRRHRRSAPRSPGDREPGARPSRRIVLGRALGAGAPEAHARRRSAGLTASRVHRGSGVVYFAPEVKALLAAPGICKDLDPAALGIFLGAGHLLSTQTLFTAVRRLSAGQRLILDPRLSGSSAVRLEGEDRYRLSASGTARRRAISRRSSARWCAGR